MERTELTDSPAGASLLLPARLAALLALALAYFVAGRLGLLLAIPPGFSSAVWPASGIALGALVVFGPRLWPGVLLGSFCVNASMSFDATDASSMICATLVATAIGVGASLQALVGYRLVRRCIGLPNALEDWRSVIGFLSLAGPIACLTNATVSVGTLFAVGAVPPSNLLFNWFTWWAGDSVGVLIFAPLLLVAFGRPRPVWRPRAATVALPLAAAFAVVVVFFVLARASESTAIRERFRNDASDLTHALAADLINDIEVLRGVERFYANSRGVEREEFRGFVTRALEHRPGLTALSWNAVVTEPERAAYVHGVRAEGFPGFEIYERTGNGERVVSPVRSEHVVVTFIEPQAKNESAMGFDVASNADRRAALERARDTGEPSATRPIRLVQSGPNDEGMLVFMPVYRRDAPTGTQEERRAAILGFAVGVMQFHTLIDASLRRFDRSGLELRIRDSAAAAGDPPFYAERAGFRVGGFAAPGSSVARDHTDLTVEREVAGRRWVLSFARTQDYLAAHRAWHVWMVMAGGMGLAGTLGVFLLVLTGRTLRIAAMVDERTADLSRANAALTESERRFQLAVEGSSVGIWEWTIATGEDYLSPRWKALLGYRDDELPNVVASWSERLHPDDTERVLAAVRAHLERREPYEAEYRLRCKSGEYRWCQARGQAVWDADGTPVKMAGSLVDVHTRKQAEDALERASVTDRLTGLPNRSLLLDRLGQAMKRAARFPERGYAVLFLDFDRFKLVNDTLGHDAGDQLLVRIAERLRVELRATDSIVALSEGNTAARLGGDEFVVILDDLARPEDAHLVTARLVETLAEPYEIAGQEVVSGASIGLVIGDASYAEPSEVLRDADVAMYEAKAAGKGRYVVFDAAMRDRFLRRVELERQLTAVIG